MSNIFARAQPQLQAAALHAAHGLNTSGTRRAPRGGRNSKQIVMRRSSAADCQIQAASHRQSTTPAVALHVRWQAVAAPPCAVPSAEERLKKLAPHFVTHAGDRVARLPPADRIAHIVDGGPEAVRAEGGTRWTERHACNTAARGALVGCSSELKAGRCGQVRRAQSTMRKGRRQ